MIAVRDKDTVFAVGNEAYEMFEKSPENIDVVTPMSNNRISDVMLVEAILHTLLARCHTFMGLSSDSVFLCSHGYDRDRKESLLFHHPGKLKNAGFFWWRSRLPTPWHWGIPIHRTRGSAIANIGAQGYGASVIADERVIISKIFPIGGKQFNAAIAAGVRRKNSFQISRKTAKRLKISD